MKVFKFGGASVKDAESIKNVANIIRLFPNESFTVVISAMGKTTNKLEQLTRTVFETPSLVSEKLNDVIHCHEVIIRDLFGKDFQTPKQITDLFDDLRSKTKNSEQLTFNQLYDQIVSLGELLSTSIVAHYLIQKNISTDWLDVRTCIKTNNRYREAEINWARTQSEVTKNIKPLLSKPNNVVITQGFIGESEDGLTTTLGREGSDYSASILAYCLEAKQLTIWKDVPGVLNADPKYFDNTVKLDKLSYQDAIELAYYGASVIHPKTIQPLQSKGIKLHVRSFLNTELPGTLVGEDSYDSLIPTFIFKMNQVMISIASKDFSFIAEDYLQQIFGIFAKHNIKINLMQNSAISFLVCVNNEKDKIEELSKELEQHFKIQTEDQLELITIRYFDSATIERVTKNKDVILQQKGKKTIQLVVKDLGNGLTI